MANSGFCNKFSEILKACQIYFFNIFGLHLEEMRLMGFCVILKISTENKKRFERYLKLNMVNTKKFEKWIILYALVTHDRSKNLS